LFAVILSVVGVFDAASAAGRDAPLTSRHANLIPPSLNPVISLVFDGNGRGICGYLASERKASESFLIEASGCTKSGVLAIASVAALVWNSGRCEPLDLFSRSRLSVAPRSFTPALRTVQSLFGSALPCWNLGKAIDRTAVEKNNLGQSAGNYKARSSAVTWRQY